MLRHAGAVYALASCLKERRDGGRPDAVGEEALRRAVAYLLGQIGPLPEGYPKAMALWSGSEDCGVGRQRVAKLGGAGLALIALIVVEDVDPGLSGPELWRGLGDFLLLCQKRDGAFHSKFKPADGGLRDDWKSLYYPGEAALGLTMLYEKTGDTRYLAGAVSALGRLAEDRKNASGVPPDHWALLATARVLPLYDRAPIPPEFSVFSASTSAKLLLSHAEQIVYEFASATSHLLKEDPRFGGFTGDGQTCPTAIRLEGLLAIRPFLDPNGALKSALDRRVKLGVRFLLNCQVVSGVRAGGFPRRFSGGDAAREIRIDYVQHALSALLAFRKTFQGRPESLDTLGYDLKDLVPPPRYPEWLLGFTARLSWPDWKRPIQLNGDILERSTLLGRDFMLRGQKPEGNFIYRYNFLTQTEADDDNQVRQAGALWGLALLNAWRPEENSRFAVEKGLRFFFERTRPGPTGSDSAIVAYGDDPSSKTGTVALVALSAIDYLRVLNDGSQKTSPEFKSEIETRLDGYLRTLQASLLENGLFAGDINIRTLRPTAPPSPYSDGEALLCLIKSAKYLNRRDLIPLIESVAPRMAKHYTIDQWNVEADSDLTKGFFQWSCMAFAEYGETDWKNAAELRNCPIALSWWALSVHQVTRRAKNTAYAFEGLLTAWKQADLMGNAKAADALRAAIDSGLYKLIAWQVCGPMSGENRFLRDIPQPPAFAVGGVMNAWNDPDLRIDVTQHQCHALILAQRFRYWDEAAKTPRK